MEDLLPAAEMTFQLVLEQLCGALLMMCKYLRQVPGLGGFPWETPGMDSCDSFYSKELTYIEKGKELPEGNLPG